MAIKTPTQLLTEIAYFQQIAATTTSRDRQRRALAAIQKRERRLAGVHPFSPVARPLVPRGPNRNPATVKPRRSRPKPRSPVAPRAGIIRTQPAHVPGSIALSFFTFRPSSR